MVAHYDAFGDIGIFRAWVKNAKLLWERDAENSKRIDRTDLLVAVRLAGGRPCAVLPI